MRWRAPGSEEDGKESVVRHGGNREREPQTGVVGCHQTATVKRWMSPIEACRVRCTLEYRPLLPPLLAMLRKFLRAANEGQRALRSDKSALTDRPSSPAPSVPRRAESSTAILSGARTSASPQLGVTCRASASLLTHDATALRKIGQARWRSASAATTMLRRG
jgi:hypothetical protein